ncbi:hydrogenase maturation nickel metallochaperone HypA [Ferrimonas pelagia]|uniref:Hydrogenase maturation factor HypA n=1 Tax=Ferrimonas pelagia TaxID=1177826 RepID=A0ABP9EDT1_9GAMM
MHEISLAEGILAIIERQRREGDFGCVKSVQLEIGQLAGVEVEALLFGMKAVFRDTVADGAEIELISVGGQAFCFDCESQVPLAKRGEACPGCGGYRLHVNDGDQMRVKSLEVE